MNGFKNYKFSIIIPNYNGGRFLEWCLKSIINQQYKNYEVIIVDWKSNDNSHKIIQKYVSNNIKWVNKTDKWISSWFNIWIKYSSWDFILFLWSDDYLYYNILEKVNNYINNVCNYWLFKNMNINIFCDSINYYAKNNYFEKRNFPSKFINKYNLIKYWTLVWLQNIYFNRKWILKNKLDENNKYSMDYDVYFRMLKDNEIFIYIPEINSINYQWDNISCKFLKQSFKEWITVAKRYSSNLIDYINIYKRIIIFNIIILLKWLFKR